MRINIIEQTNVNEVIEAETYNAELEEWQERKTVPEPKYKEFPFVFFKSDLSNICQGEENTIIIKLLSEPTPLLCKFDQSLWDDLEYTINQRDITGVITYKYNGAQM